MREANIEPIPAIVHQDPIAHDNTEENFKTFMHLSVGQLMPYLSQPRSVDAIMLTSDGVLASTAAACRLFGITPNREVLLVGYDNFWPDDAPANSSRRFRRRPSISRTKSSASNSLNCSWAPAENSATRRSIGWCSLNCLPRINSVECATSQRRRYQWSDNELGITTTRAMAARAMGTGP